MTHLARRALRPAPALRLAPALRPAGLLVVLASMLAVPARSSRRRRWADRLRTDAGMSTAEYAVGTVAAVAFAAVLYKVVQSGAVQSALSAIVEGALNVSL